MSCHDGPVLFLGVGPLSFLFEVQTTKTYNTNIHLVKPHFSQRTLLQWLKCRFDQIPSIETKTTSTVNLNHISLPSAKKTNLQRLQHLQPPNCSWLWNIMKDYVSTSSLKATTTTTTTTTTTSMTSFTDVFTHKRVSSHTCMPFVMDLLGAMDLNKNSFASWVFLLI